MIARRGAMLSREDSHVVHFLAELYRSGHPRDQGCGKRAQTARELAKKVGAEIKQIYMTTGDSDLVVMVEAPNGDIIAKFALALGMQGNVRTRTARAWTMEEFQKLVAELP
jgi:uncharacterized protein with GYD domain